MNYMRIMAVFCSLMMFPMHCLSYDAEDFIIEKENGKVINIDNGHYSIAVLKGWTSKKDSFFKKVLSDAGNQVVSVKSKTSFFEDSISNSLLHESQGITKDMDHPWGINKTIINKIPADYPTDIDISVVINRESNITKIINAVNSAQNLMTQDFSLAWNGYSSVVDNIFNNIFGANKNNFPFSWSGTIMKEITSGGSIKEHYRVIISPGKEGESIFKEKDITKFGYDEHANNLTYDGSPLEDYSYAVIEVKHEDGWNIRRLTRESMAPWAVFARNQFDTFPTSSADNDELKGLQQRVLKALKEELELLIREKRFSKYERVLALTTYAARAKSAIERKCEKLEVTENCPTDELVQYITHVADDFGLSKTSKDMLFKDSSDFKEELFNF